MRTAVEGGAVGWNGASVWLPTYRWSLRVRVKTTNILTRGCDSRRKMLCCYFKELVKGIIVIFHYKKLQKNWGGPQPCRVDMQHCPCLHLTLVVDRNQIVSRRFKLNSRTTWIGEPPNRWDLLQPQYVMPLASFSSWITCAGTRLGEEKQVTLQISNRFTIYFLA
jgi:hypothetical protein